MSLASCHQEYGPNSPLATGTAVIVVLVTLATVTPVLLLWALNVLFRCSIPYTFRTWVAALLLLTLTQRFQPMVGPAGLL